VSDVLATVTAAGFATVQDGGRHGHVDVGVPVSGAWHRERYLVATALLSGGPDMERPAVELLGGLLALDTARPLVLAVVGPADLEIDGRRAAVGSALTVAARSRVVVSSTGRGPVYLVIDGWRPALVLGSASTDTFAGIGGGLLTAGSVLRGTAEDGAAPSSERVGAFHRPLSEPVGPVRVVATGHPSLDAFVGARWTVTAAARSGIRLSGGSLATAETVASAPVLPGAIQVTPSGESIILGPDGGLTGGYPVVAVVATVDLDRTSLLQVGNEMAFRVIGIAEAAAAWRERVALLSASTAHPDHLP
jgi:allophanate hydrolase subunit 2